MGRKPLDSVSRCYAFKLLLDVHQATVLPRMKLNYDCRCSVAASSLDPLQQFSRYAKKDKDGLVIIPGHRWLIVREYDRPAVQTRVMGTRPPPCHNGWPTPNNRVLFLVCGPVTVCFQVSLVIYRVCTDGDLAETFIHLKSSKNKFSLKTKY